jgi:hypothetical protein
MSLMESNHELDRECGFPDEIAMWCSGPDRESE